MMMKYWLARFYVNALNIIHYNHDKLLAMSAFRMALRKKVTPLVHQPTSAGLSMFSRLLILHQVHAKVKPSAMKAWPWI